jgi:hypothetical protein
MKQPKILGIEIHEAVVKALAKRDEEWRLAIARASHQGPRGGPPYGYVFGHLKLTWNGLKSRCGKYKITRNRVPVGSYTIHCDMMWVGQENSLKAAQEAASHHYERYGYEA